MDVISLLATSQGRKDDVPNQQLAGEIIRLGKAGWVEQLVNHLNHVDKNIQSDCIKVLYEIGLQGSPVLISPYCNEFIDLLKSKNNRLVWGAMTALSTIASINPGCLFKRLSEIVEAIDKGSVITIDGGVGVLSQLAGFKEYTATSFPLLLEQLKKCPVKQLGSYGEKALQNILSENKLPLKKVLEKRLAEVEKESQKSRILKTIKKLEKID
jgi:hypothetical protein